MPTNGTSLLDFLKTHNRTERPTGDRKFEQPPAEYDMQDANVLHPKIMQGNKMTEEDNKKAIIDDSGNYSTDQSNKFLDNLKAGKNPFSSLLENGGNGPGTISGFISRMLSPTPEAQNGNQLSPPSIGGTGDPNHIPGTGQDAVLNPTPMQDQKQPNLTSTDQTPTPTPLPTPDPRRYEMPTALDPQSIEELRLSLMTQAGQLDPNNPNGLSGRMNSPNAESDMGKQRNEAMGIEDSIRGFNGGPKPRNQHLSGDFIGNYNDLPEDQRSGNYTGSVPYSGDPKEFMKRFPDNVEGVDVGGQGDRRQMMTRPRKPPVAIS